MFQPIPTTPPVVRVIISEALQMVEMSQSKNGKVPRHHVTAVKSLIDHIGDLYVDDVTEAMILSWYVKIKGAEHDRKAGKLSPWTVDNYGRMMKAFFSNCVKLGLISISPCTKIKLPRLPKKSKKDITDADIDKLIKHARWHPRDYALILVLRDTGARVGGIVSMRASDVKITEKDGVLSGKILVYEKMNKGRYVYFSHETCVSVQNYLDARPVDSPDQLWLNNHYTPLSENGVYQALERIAKRAGVDRFNPHSFRHAMAKRLINSGAPIKAIADLMGHEDVTLTMQMYVTYDDDELEKIHQKYNRR